MNKETTKYDGKILERVNKKEAYEKYLEGKEIYVCPVLANPENPWIGLMEIRWTKDKWMDKETYWKYIINAYQAYNCNAELGKYPKFFIKKEKEE